MTSSLSFAGGGNVLTTSGSFKSNDFDRAESADFPAIITDLQSKNWTVQVYALRKLREVASGDLAPFQQTIANGTMLTLLQNIVDCMQSARSQLAEEAILTADATLKCVILKCFPRTKKYLDYLISSMVQKIHTDKHFLSDRIFEALAELARYQDRKLLLQYISILQPFLYKSASAITAGTSQLIAIVVHTYADMQALSVPLFQNHFLPMLSHMLIEKSSASRKAAKDILHCAYSNLKDPSSNSSSEALTTFCVQNFLKNSGLSSVQKLTLEKAIKQCQTLAQTEGLNSCSRDEPRLSTTYRHRSATLPPASRRCSKNQADPSAAISTECNPHISVSRQLLETLKPHESAKPENDFMPPAMQPRIHRNLNTMSFMTRSQCAPRKHLAYFSPHTRLTASNYNQSATQILSPQYTSQLQVSQKVQDILQGRSESNAKKYPSSPCLESQASLGEHLPSKENAAVQHNLTGIQLKMLESVNYEDIEFRSRPEQQVYHRRGEERLSFHKKLDSDESLLEDCGRKGIFRPFKNKPVVDEILDSTVTQWNDQKIRFRAPDYNREFCQKKFNAKPKIYYDL